jgi:ubiquinone/menaquinone biosynthesis C-methylase UbiE
MRIETVKAADIPSVVTEYIQGSEHPDLQVYRRDLGDAGFMQVWQWRIQHYCDLGGFYGKRILEVGCGFGWDAVGLALTGGNEVVASDILPSMIEGMSECLTTMEKKGKKVPVTPLQGDICNLDLPSESFDGIFTTEAIEHVHNLPLMFQNCYRLLKPGGVALIVNDSNRYNAAACAHSWEGWTDRDQSWEHVDWLKGEVRPVEHADAKPYGVMREEIIRAADSGLTDADIAALRAATAGMIRLEIEQAIAEYNKTGKLTKPDEFRWCRNPETGEYSERLLDPWELKQWLRDAGFQVQLRHVFRKMPLRALNGINFRPLNKWLFGKRALFALVAMRPSHS